VSDHGYPRRPATGTARGGLASRVGHATQILVEAALAWGDRDYGEVGELEADAALSDAIREFKEATVDEAVAGEASRAAS
jgi:hypothetical protein